MRPTPVLSVLALLAAPAWAQSTDLVAASVDAARAEIERTAAAADADADGRITPAEMRAVASALFPSIDADGSGAILRDEFLGWEFGLQDMAAFRDRAQGYEAAMGMAFDLFDRDGDHGIDAAELERGMDAASAYADRNGDGAMDRAEFRQNFVINVALRNALVPQATLSDLRR